MPLLFILSHKLDSYHIYTYFEVNTPVGLHNLHSDLLNLYFVRFMINKFEPFQTTFKKRRTSSYIFK